MAELLIIPWASHRIWRQTKKVQGALKNINTAEIKDKPVTDLTGGQKQHVWIAMALAQDTKVLFPDEPTTYLKIQQIDGNPFLIPV